MNDTWNPSSEELELLSTPDDIIMERHQVFCFNHDDFIEKVQSGDRWQQLIQAHLYFEHVVAQLLKEALAKPEAISMSRMGFSQRLDLVVAMALLPDELVIPVRKISGLRNKIAHDLAFEIADKDVQDLENCTPIHLRKALLQEEDRGGGRLHLHELLIVILLKADIVRQHLAANREIAKKSELRLRSALKKIPKVNYAP
ncbi:hypothetical protein PX699_10030 [Sphingobium sp. H39-3-25]|uniref:hypothetical protein n=1 Tax=Sphingobium arseniciresistens TaxID=3030834 RepID=UPI0023B9AA06|nr:hypothetical protein [Sphingobium arseniciresistens]